MSSSVPMPMFVGGVQYVPVVQKPREKTMWDQYPLRILYVTFKFIHSILLYLLNCLAFISVILIVCFVVFIAGPMLVKLSYSFYTISMDYFHAHMSASALKSNLGYVFREIVFKILPHLCVTIFSSISTLIWAERRKEKKVVLESAQPGSPIVDTKDPKFQFMVTDATAGTPFVYGRGCRMMLNGLDCLVTAAHVLSELPTDIGLRGPGGAIVVKRSDFKLLPNIDIAYLPFVVETFGVLALAKAKTASPQQGQMACVSASGKGSFGILSEAPFFGRIYYTGSTTAGYSGAPYYLGNIVYGIHLGSAGSANFGVEIGFIAVEALHPSEDEVTYEDMITQEDTWTMLEKLVDEEANEVSWRDTPNGFVQIKSKRGWDLVDPETEQGGRILAKLRGRKTRGARLESDKPLQTEAAISPDVLPTISVSYDDQAMKGSFLGRRRVVLERPRQAATPTYSVPTNIPLTGSSVMAGQTPVKVQLETHCPSTKPSPPKPKKAPIRKPLIESLLRLSPTIAAGDQARIASALASNLPNAGLRTLLTELSPTSTGRLA